MSEKNFSHVCTVCHAPTLASKTRGSILQTILLWGVILLAFSLFGWLGLVVGIASALLIAFKLNRKRAVTCPACHSSTLIPVATPQGMKIMKDIGWVES